MKKIISLLILLLFAFKGFGQDCPEPDADAVQYFCTGESESLADLEVTGTGTLEWYDDAGATNSIPSTTTIVDGEIYYVTNTDSGCAESDPIAIKVYEQSVEFEVTPTSCVDLGANVFFVEEGDLGSPVEIEVNNLDGNPFDEEIKWSSTDLNLNNDVEYYLLGGGPYAMPPQGTIGGANPINHIQFIPDLYDITEFELEIPVGDGCSPSDESITIIAGGLEFGICFGGGETLADAFAEFENLWEDAENKPEWYDESTGGSVMPGSTKVKAEETYFLDFGISGCDVRIPVKIEYEHAAPMANEEQYFCSSAALSIIGISDDQTLDDLAVAGEDLQWYDDSFNPVSNPGSEVLQDGGVYYVTDEFNGCESEPLRIELTERDCACESPVYEFYSHSISSTRDANACAVDFYTNIPTSIPMGTTNGMSGNQDDAVYVTPGLDPNLSTANIDLPRTSPYGTGISRPIRLNTDKSGSATRVFARKDIVAGEIAALDFAVVLENPSHSHDQQPFFEVNVYDSNDQLVQTRCVVSDPNDCIFHSVGSAGGMSNVLYSEWSSIIIDTREIQGEAGKIEFIVSWCSPTAHVGYAYIDNVFIGDAGDERAGEQSFGYMDIETVDDGSLIYDDDCSYLETNVQQQECEPVLPALNPDFPIEVCGNLANPVASQSCDNPLLNSIGLDIYKDGTNVGTISQANTSPSGGVDFCFEINESDVSGPLYGYFNLDAEAVFEMSPNSGSSYEYVVTTKNTGFKICPVAECVDDLSVCIPADATPFEGEFNLTDQDDLALGNYDPSTYGNYEITYYEDLADAHNENNSILNPSQYTVGGGSHTVYLRIDYDWSALNMTPEDDCYDIISFEVHVASDPELPTDPIEVIKCEDPSGVTEFDLEDSNLRDKILSEVAGNKSDFDLEFYETNTGAENKDNNDLIIDPDAYEVASTGTITIYVRIESEGECYSVFPIDLTVEPSPTLSNYSITMKVCEDGSGNNTGDFDIINDGVPQVVPNPGNYTIGVYGSLQDAQGGDSQNTLSNPYKGTDGEIVYVRVMDPYLGCFSIAEIELEVLEAPTVPPLDPLELCDTGNGEADFDLDDLITYIQDGDSSLDVSFYGSETDADNEQNPISSPYTSGDDTVYVRVGEPALDCAVIVPLDLVVNDLPELPTDPIAIEQCEEEQGDNEFDLSDSSLHDAILNEVQGDVSDYDIDFYASQTGAENAQSGDEIDPTLPYVISGPTTETIWVRVENTITECGDVMSVDLVVNPLPTINEPVLLRICEDGSGNGTAEFDLNEATLFMIGTNPDLDVSYYADQNDAEVGDPGNALPRYYTNIVPDNEIIYAHIENTGTGCYIVEPVELEVDEAPEANTPPPLVFCDENNDNQGWFYLPDAEPHISTDPDVDISFHRTHADAENDANVLPDTIYNNQLWTNQTIYVRVEKSGVDCYTIVELELQVKPTPILIEPIEPLVACDEDGTGVQEFDLRKLVEDEVLNDLQGDRNDYDIYYYANEQDRDNDVRISSPSSYSSAGGTVIVKVVDKDTGCSSEIEIELLIAPMPEVFNPEPLELCDINDPGDEKEFFDLHDADEEITGGDRSYEVSYYETQSDADQAQDSLTSPYENIENNQTIYIRVENEHGCVVTENITLTLVVNPLPDLPDNLGPIEVCDANNDGHEEFNLDAITDSIKIDQSHVEVTYHLTEATAERGTNPINSSEDFENTDPDNQTIWVRAENENTGCYAVSPLDLIVVPSPEIQGLEDLYVCDDDDNGFAVFDLTINADNIFGSEPSGDLEITYHEDADAADNGENPIAVPTNYTNVTNPQTIYVRLTDTITGCYDTFDYEGDNSFMLHVEETPQLEDAYLAVCNEEGIKDPYPQAVFDLTAGLEDLTGHTQLRSDQEIYYYASEEDRDNNNPIANPNAYVNASNPQDIYVEVVNANTRNLCTGEALLTIEVLPPPISSEPDADKLRLTRCDISTDGIAEEPFDLTLSGDMIAGGDNVELEYYKTESAALSGNKSSDEFIDDPENYINEPDYNRRDENGLPTNIQVIYVRVIAGADGNSCFIVVPIELEVVPAPLLNPEGDPFGYTLCEDSDTGEAALDLSDIAHLLYDYSNGEPSDLISLLDEDPSTNQGQSLDLDDYDITYYLNEADAEAGEGDNMVPPGYPAADGEEIYVRVEDPETGCHSAIGKIVITIEARPVAEPITISIDPVCSDEPGGSTVTVDLTEYDEMINPGEPEDTEVVYFEDIDDYHNFYPIEDPTEVVLGEGQSVIGAVIDQNTLCRSIDYAEIMINVETRPMVDLSPYDGEVICVDLDPVTTPTEDPGSESIVIDTELPEGGDYLFAWDKDGDLLNGETGSSLEVTEAGTYTVTVTNNRGLGCETSESVTIIENNPPEYSIKPTKPAFSDGGGVLIYNVIGNGDYEFRVDDGPWLPLDEDGTVEFANLTPGEHLIYGRDKGGCGITIIPFSLIDYPDFFTPNDDGFNDTWNIVGLEDQPNAKIYIFDRYGKLLKQLRPDGEGWEGTYNGKEMPSNDYWFRVEYKETTISQDGSFSQYPAVFKGHFTLKR